jgi:hypothetical protein
VTEPLHRAAWPLALLVACALAGAGWAVLRTPLGPGEAALVLRARDPGTAPCAPAPGRGVLELAGCGLPGAAAVVARAAELADGRGGLRAARWLLALAAPALVLLVHLRGRSPRWGGHGLLAAATFVALGVPLQLVATVHPRAVAALLVALAAALVDVPRGLPRGPPEVAPRPGTAALRAATAGAALALAATATPVAALFALPLALALAPGRKEPGAAAAFAGAAAIVVALSAIAGRAAWDGVADALRACPPGGWSAAPRRLAALVDGLAMPLLLAAFAVFHRAAGARAAGALVLAAPALLVPLLGPRLDDVRTAQLLAVVILAPAAGLGVERMAETFATGNPWRAARPIFAGAVLVVAAVHGVDQARTLRRDGPDLSPAVAFLRAAGPGGRTLLVESDHGSPERVYRYQLGTATRVVAVARADVAERREALRATRPDWIVLDAHHADRSFGAAEQDYLASGFAVAARWDVPVGAGTAQLEVLQREAR